MRSEVSLKPRIVWPEHVFAPEIQSKTCFNFLCGSWQRTRILTRTCSLRDINKHVEAIVVACSLESGAYIPSGIVKQGTGIFGSPFKVTNIPWPTISSTPPTLPLTISVSLERFRVIMTRFRLCGVTGKEMFSSDRTRPTRSRALYNVPAARLFINCTDAFVTPSITVFGCNLNNKRIVLAVTVPSPNKRASETVVNHCADDHELHICMYKRKNCSSDRNVVRSAYFVQVAHNAGALNKSARVPSAYHGRNCCSSLAVTTSYQCPHAFHAIAKWSHGTFLKLNTSSVNNAEFFRNL